MEPDDDDKAFVADFSIDYGDEDELENECDDKKFRIFFTTKRLMKTALKSNKIHADATYKLTWEGVPVLISGTTDLDRHFHPFGISVCSNERTEDFKFIFKALANSLEKLNLSENLQINTLISDASYAIRNGFTNVFGDDTMLIMCWAHVRRNVVKNLHLVAEEFRDDVMEDIDSLQLASNKEIFEKASLLFVKKWRTKRQYQFTDYMNEMWLSTHQNWYEGIASYTPSQNNALESFNLRIKKEETFRERMPLSRFLQQSLESVERWSKEYKSNDKQFISVPSVGLKQWTDGYHWAKSNKIVTSKILENSVEYYSPVSQETKTTEEQIQTVKEMRWTTFDQYKKRAFNIWIVNFPKDTSDMNEKWKEGQCTCPTFLKKFMCKHVIGLSIRLKYVKPPPAAKQVPIGEKRRRGRPNKATKALLVD